MRRLTILFTLLCLISSILLFTNIYAKKGSKKNIIGSVKIVKGKAYYAPKKTKKFKRLKTRKKIYENTIIKTKKKTYVTLMLKNGSLIEIKENSRILLNKKILDKSSVSVTKGKVKFSIKKMLKKKRSFNVYTPTAVAGIRGTDFEVVVADDGSLLTNVEEGEVEVDTGKKRTSVKSKESVEAPVESDDLNKNNKLVDADDWNEEKDKEIKTNPKDKMDAVGDNLTETLKNQKKMLKEISETEDTDEQTSKNVDQALFNQCKSEGLIIAADNIRKKNKKKSSIQKSYKKIKKIYDRLDKLNRLLDEKFARLEKIYADNEERLENKFKDNEDKLNKKLDNYKWKE